MIEAKGQRTSQNDHSPGDQTAFLLCAPEVKDILDHRKAKADDRSINDTVQNAVELVARQPKDSQQGHAF